MRRGHEGGVAVKKSGPIRHRSGDHGYRIDETPRVGWELGVRMAVMVLGGWSR